MCVHAGRASPLDKCHVLDQAELGRIAAARIDDLARFRRLAALEPGTADDHHTPGRLPARLSPSFTAALDANRRPVFRGAVFSLYDPDAAAAGR